MHLCVCVLQAEAKIIGRAGRPWGNEPPGPGPALVPGLLGEGWPGDSEAYLVPQSIHGLLEGLDRVNLLKMLIYL